MNTVAEYAVIGAGPAGICAVAALLKHGVNPERVQWVDPLFKVGDFGTNLSKGSGVPGNTSVKTFSDVLDDIYQTVLNEWQGNIPQSTFHALLATQTCHLNDAARPFQEVSNRLQAKVVSIKASVDEIITVKEGFQLCLHSGDVCYSKRVIVASGSKPKAYDLAKPFDHIINIDPTVAFIYSQLGAYLKEQTHLQTVAVIGSSHSAALATMHLLQHGVQVKQFMTKPYRYAAQKITPEGVAYVEYDNTGLKGDVAQFSRDLQRVSDIKSTSYKDKLTYYIAQTKEELTLLLEQHLEDVSHKVVAIGYTKNDTLLFNGQSMLLQNHNALTTEFVGVKGLFGVGIAYPQEVNTIWGEKELAVGIAKFWLTMNDKKVIAAWSAAI